MAEATRQGSLRTRPDALKEAIARCQKSQYRRITQNKLEYLDSMQESLNKEIQASVNPHWRNHRSLKGKFTSRRPITVANILIFPGWTSMNYPTTVTNPLLKKHMQLADKKHEEES